MMKSSIALALTLSSLLCSQGAIAQHNWDLQARAKSQAQASRALNMLVGGPKVKGGLDQAIILLNAAVNSDPTDPVPYSLLGLALSQKGSYQEALNALSTALKLDSKLKETMLSIAVTQYLGHQYDRAVNDLGRLLTFDASFCKVYINLGFCLIKMGDFDKARELFNTAIKCDARSQAAYQGLATADYLSGNLDNALREATYADSIESYAPVTLLIAEINFLRGDLPACKAACQKLTKSKPPFRQRSMTQIGFVAQHDFHWDPYLNEDFDNVYAVMSRSLNLPAEASKQNSFVSRGKLADRQAGVEAALNNFPTDFYLLRQSGLLLLAQGQFAKAADQFDKALSSCENDHVDYLYEGRALSLDGQKEAAAQCIASFQNNMSKQSISAELAAIAKAVPLPPPKPAVQAPTAPAGDSKSGF